MKHLKCANDALPDTVKAHRPKDTLIARLRASLEFCAAAIGNRLADKVTVDTPTGRGGGLPLSNWQNTGACEDAFAVPDSTDANIVWFGRDNGRLVRMDYRTGMARDVSAWPITSYGWAPEPWGQGGRS